MGRSIWQFDLTRIALMLAALPAAGKISFCAIMFVKVLIDWKITH